MFSACVCEVKRHELLKPIVSGAAAHLHLKGRCVIANPQKKTQNCISMGTILFHYRTMLPYGNIPVLLNKKVIIVSKQCDND